MKLFESEVREGLAKVKQRAEQAAGKQPELEREAREREQAAAQDREGMRRSVREVEGRVETLEGQIRGAEARMAEEQLNRSAEQEREEERRREELQQREERAGREREGVEGLLTGLAERVEGLREEGRRERKAAGEETQGREEAVRSEVAKASAEQRQELQACWARVPQTAAALEPIELAHRQRAAKPEHAQARVDRALQVWLSRAALDCHCVERWLGSDLVAVANRGERLTLLRRL
jgi:hypothetical protein